MGLDLLLSLFLLLFLLLFPLSLHLLFLSLLLPDNLGNIVKERPPPINLLQCIIVDPKLRKQNLVFLPRVGIFQYLFNFLVAFASLDHFPEDSVVEIVDVAVDLPPPEVVFDDCVVGIQHDAAVECGYLLELDIEVFAPVKDVSRGKGRDHAAQNLLGPAGEESGIFVEDEGVLVGLAVRQKYLAEACADMLSRSAHQIYRSEIVGLGEVMGSAEFGEAPSLMVAA